tara:strand:+ start:508 stop:1509 length:1002 start_codon:yes stop_codon:yes gene_type:complete
MKKNIDIDEKIFVAGSSGMVGSSVCRILKKFGYGDIRKGGKILTPSRNELNLLDTTKVRDWFNVNKPTVVIIAAAKVGGIAANSNFPAQFILENIKIQTNLIEAAWLNNVKRLLFLGSSSIYPHNAQQPLKEEYLLNGALEKSNQWYSIAKISGIKLCEALRIEYDFDAISLIPANLYGPKDNFRNQNSHVMAGLIKRFIDAKNKSLKEVICWGTGTPTREFLHVDDLAKAIVFALEKWDPTKEYAPRDKYGNPLFYLNVGSGEEISIKNLALKLAQELAYKGSIKWDENINDGVPRKLLDSKKFQSLGWNAKINLDKGIKKLLKEIKSENRI